MYLSVRAPVVVASASSDPKPDTQATLRRMRRTTSKMARLHQANIRRLDRLARDDVDFARAMLDYVKNRTDGPDAAPLNPLEYTLQADVAKALRDNFSDDASDDEK